MQELNCTLIFESPLSILSHIVCYSHNRWHFMTMCFLSVQDGRQCKVNDILDTLLSSVIMQMHALCLTYLSCCGIGLILLHCMLVMTMDAHSSAFPRRSTTACPPGVTLLSCVPVHDWLTEKPCKSMNKQCCRQTSNAICWWRTETGLHSALHKYSSPLDFLILYSVTTFETN